MAMLYRLKPEAGDAAPHNEIGGGNILSGGSISLVDRSGGAGTDMVWQFSSGDSTATGITKNIAVADAAGGMTMAFTSKITTEPTIGGAAADFTRYLQMYNASDANIYFGNTKNGATKQRARYSASGGSNIDLGAIGGTERTYVLRLSTNGSGQERLDVWINRTGRTDATPDWTNSGTTLSTVFNRLLVGAANGLVQQIKDWIIWDTEESNSFCASIADDLRGVLDAPDTTAPTMNGSISSSNITSTGFRMDWIAATDNVAVTGYEVSTNGGSTWTDVGNVLTVTSSGLANSTLYSTRVRAYDAAGNKATPLSLDITTSAPSSDTTPPTHTGTLASSNITQSGFTLTWPAGTDNVGVTGYEYSINGGTSWIDAGNVLTVTLSGLTAETAYSTRARAYDAAGNRSTPALSATVTTAAASTGTITSPKMYNIVDEQPRADETGITVFVSNPTTGDKVVVLTGETTDSEAVCVFSHASITTGSDYRVTWKFSDGEEGTAIRTAT